MSILNLRHISLYKMTLPYTWTFKMLATTQFIVLLTFVVSHCVASPLVYQSHSFETTTSASASTAFKRAVAAQPYLDGHYCQTFQEWQTILWCCCGIRRYQQPDLCRHLELTIQCCHTRIWDEVVKHSTYSGRFRLNWRGCCKSFESLRIVSYA